MLLLGLVLTAALLIALRYALAAPQRRRRKALGEDGWWDGRTDVWRYDKHHWGWGWRP